MEREVVFPGSHHSPFSFICTINHVNKTLSISNKIQPELVIHYKRLIKSEKPIGIGPIETGIIAEEEDGSYVCVYYEAFRFRICEGDSITSFRVYDDRHRSYNYAEGEKHFYILNASRVILPKEAIQKAKGYPISFDGPCEFYQVIDDLLSGKTYLLNQEVLRSRGEYYNPLIDDLSIHHRHLINATNAYYAIFKEIQEMCLPMKSEWVMTTAWDPLARALIKDMDGWTSNVAMLLINNEDFGVISDAFRQCEASDPPSKEQMLYLLGCTQREDLADWIADKIGQDKLMEKIVTGRPGQDPVVFDNAWCLFRYYDLCVALWLLKRPYFRDYIDSRTENCPQPFGSMFSVFQKRIGIPLQDVVRILNGLKMHCFHLSELFDLQIYHPDLLRCCLDGGADLFATVTTERRDIIQDAIKENKAAFIKNIMKVLDEGSPKHARFANIFKGDQSNQKHLTLALKHGSFHVVELLLEHMSVVDFKACFLMLKPGPVTQYEHNLVKNTKNALNRVWVGWIWKIYALIRTVDEKYFNLKADCPLNISRFFLVCQKLHIDVLVRICKLVYSHPSYHQPAVSIEKIHQAIFHFLEVQLK